MAKMVTIWRCSCCGEEDKCGLGRNNEFKCMTCGEYTTEEDYVEITEEEYERWRNAKPGRI